MTTDSEKVMAVKDPKRLTFTGFLGNNRLLFILADKAEASFVLGAGISRPYSDLDTRCHASGFLNKYKNKAGWKK